MLKTSDDEDDQERLANIEELITAAKQFHDEDTTRTLGDFLENITLASDVDSWDEKQDCVAVMTLHAAKGLEFPVVYMLAMEQGILPHERSLVQDAGSRGRAASGLCRHHAGQGGAVPEPLPHARFRGQTLYAVGSMFLDEIPEKGVEVHSSRAGRGNRPSWGGGASWKGSEEIALPRTEYKKSPSVSPMKDDDTATPRDFQVGALVHHETYGVGRILKVTGHGGGPQAEDPFHQGGRTHLHGQHGETGNRPGRVIDGIEKRALRSLFSFSPVTYFRSRGLVGVGISNRMLSWVMSECRQQRTTENRARRTK